MKIGIIGGSGIDSPDILSNQKTLKINTPYGPTSGMVKTGKIKNIQHLLSNQ